ncbi:hypothetical protein NU219Hw_g7646t1 [Hortaea werneckii]
MSNVRELRPLNLPTADELAGPRFTRFFHGAERLCNFPPPTGPSIYFYKGNIGQSGAQAVLSNFHLCGFYDPSGLYFNSSEARYQVEKACYIEKHACKRRYQHKWNTERLPDSLDSTNVRQFVHSQTAPSMQKTATGDFWGESFEAEWNERQLEVLLIANRLKYFGCPEERKYLLGTGTRELVKASPSDAHCGIGYSAAKAEENRHKWGDNKHGIALMQVRHELREILADNPSHFDELDRRPHVHRLDFKKPSAAFHEGAFDVPGMPTYQQQHLQAIADIYKKKTRQATRSYMSWKHGQSSGPAGAKIMIWGPYEKTMGAARAQKSFLSRGGFDVVNGSSGLTPEEEDDLISTLQDVLDRHERRTRSA